MSVLEALEFLGRLQGIVRERGHAYDTVDAVLAVSANSPADALARCAADVGMPGDTVRAFLDSNDGTEEVHQMLQAAAQAEITAVPTFVLDGRWAVPGAQDAETFVNVIRRLLQRCADEAPAEPSATADSCADESCDV